ncbi:complex I subunit 5 family protein [Thioalkalivibrio sp. ALR17-21]|uniref:complex I subunit 5 family protein n=1 Tax=Thioalkalivibrio sp. ALR17-21 TaxID=1269813 RepID=UPI0004139316|nr:proton-conducting transporter membrane subunit [Thioalkalivibrio sp. ALR17-21]
MNVDGGLLLLAILASSLVPGLLIFFLPEERHGLRTLLNLSAAGIKLVLVGMLLLGVQRGETFEFGLTLLPGVDFVLAADALSLLFATLSSILWFVTTLYAIGYLEGSPRRSRFFGFFSLCVSATVGIALSGNLITFVIFYEILTLATWPLVVHRGTPEALRAGRLYLAYTITSGLVLLVAVIALNLLAGSQPFESGGYLRHLSPDTHGLLQVIGLALIAGFAVKAALIPLHSWLPRAMVAPAPVSALLHAVAVVKAGAFGLVRTFNDVFGLELAATLHLTDVLLVLAALTILYGSIQALRAHDIKQRLAFSTVSQVSYIALGLALAGPLGVVGGLVHLVHQGLTKITLFFCAGNFAETLGIHEIREMRGVGRRMPLTMAAFTVGGLGMIGLPPLAGFISKWYLGLGALEGDAVWILGVLALSSLLNAAYFLPPIIAGWMAEPEVTRPPAHKTRFESHWMLLFPTLFVAVLALLPGLLAGLELSPLGWVERIVERGYVLVPGGDMDNGTGVTP